MKSTLQNIGIFATILTLFAVTSGHSQTYYVMQTFNNGGSGTDACWTGFNASSTPTTNTVFTVTSPVQSGSHAGGMYSCCGGASSNASTYYISPILPDGNHVVTFYVRQSSFFNETFDVGTVSDQMGSNYAAAYTKSTWAGTPAWEFISTSIASTTPNNRIAFRIPPASLKTYYLDSIVITNSGNSTNGCVYVQTTGLNDQEAELSSAIFPNPFNDQFTINVSQSGLMSISVFDLSSRLLCKQAFTKSLKVNTSEFAKGIYFYELSNREGVIKTGKIVKE